MNDLKWDKGNLRQLLIKQHEEYKDRGIDHQLYPESDDAFYSMWINHRMIILSLIPKECRKPGTRVIDIGGGKGCITVLLSELNLDCTTIDSLYMDQDVLNTSGQPYVPQIQSYLTNKNVKTIPYDFYENGIPLPDETFKLAIFSEVIEHLPNSPKPLLDEIRRTLLPGGWLIMTTPNLVGLMKRIKFLRGQSYRECIEEFYKMQGYPLGSVYRGHNREYTLQEINYMLREAKFSLVKAMTCNYNRYTGKKGKLLNIVRRVGAFCSPNMGDFIVVLARR